MNMISVERGWENLRLAVGLYHVVECQTATGLWFRVHSSTRLLSVENAVLHQPSCVLPKPFLLNPKDFELLGPCFVRWANGDSSAWKDANRLSKKADYVFGAMAQYASWVGTP